MGSPLEDLTREDRLDHVDLADGPRKCVRFAPEVQIVVSPAPAFVAASATSPSQRSLPPSVRSASVAGSVLGALVGIARFGTSAAAKLGTWGAVSLFSAGATFRSLLQRWLGRSASPASTPTSVPAPVAAGQAKRIVLRRERAVASLSGTSFRRPPRQLLRKLEQMRTTAQSQQRQLAAMQLAASSHSAGLSEENDALHHELMAAHEAREQAAVANHAAVLAADEANAARAEAEMALRGANAELLAAKTAKPPTPATENESLVASRNHLRSVLREERDLRGKAQLEIEALQSELVETRAEMKRQQKTARLQAKQAASELSEQQAERDDALLRARKAEQK